MIKSGYIKGKFQDSKIVHRVKKKIELELQRITKKKIKLENYHLLGLSNEKHQKIQWKIATFFWKNNLHVDILKTEIRFLQDMLGPDLLIQKKPFLRIARPNELADNIGFHKDTIYGQSPYEMSIHLPLVNLNKKSCLKVVKGSQFIKEKNIKFEKYSSNIKKGSKGHKLGTPYDPKRISEKKYKFTPIPLNIGEYMFFTPALIHGQEINSDSNLTRFSIDVRVTSKYAPIDQSKKSFNGNYISLKQSEISILAQKYFQNNPEKIKLF